MFSWKPFRTSFRGKRFYFEDGVRQKLWSVHSSRETDSLSARSLLWAVIERDSKYTHKAKSYFKCQHSADAGSTLWIRDHASALMYVKNESENESAEI